MLSLGNSDQGKTSPTQRARNNELKKIWRGADRVRKNGEYAEQQKIRLKAAVGRVLYEFSPDKIPLASTLIKGKTIPTDGLFGMIVGLNIDSYYLDCLQSIKRLSDSFANPLLLDEELLEKILKMSIALSLSIDEISLKGQEYFIDDLLDGLINSRKLYSPNKESDLYREFDLVLKSYFPNSISTRLDDSFGNWAHLVKNHKPVTEITLKGMQAAGIDTTRVREEDHMRMEEMEFAGKRVMSILGERMARAGS